MNPKDKDAAIARLVEAANQARMAFAGYVTVQSAIDKLDEALAATKEQDQ